MIIESICVGPMQVNCYVIASSEGKPAIIIDPGAEERKIRKILDKHNLTPALIINTHGHYDHIGCDDKFGVLVYAHEKEIPFLKDAQLNLSGVFSLAYEVKSEVKPLKEGQIISIEGIELKVIHTPGHSPGGICLYLQKPKDKILFSGDTLFARGIGRSDLPLGDGQLLIKGIKEKLFTLPSDTIVYPGHGEASDIAIEKETNPYLQ